MAKLIKLLLYTSFLCMLTAIMVQSENSTIHSRKLDEGNIENKCGSCPCNNPCNQPPSPPPPSPPPPSPPPPSNNCPPPPAPPVIKCPPPPSSGGGGGGGQYYPPSAPYIYINGPPGNLYPVDPYYSGSSSSVSISLVPLLLIGGLGMMAMLR